MTFVVRYEQAIYLPYDLISMCLFSFGLLCAMCGDSLLFLSTVALATYNRETAIFLVPIWIMLQVYRAKDLRRGVFVASCAALLWMFIRLQIFGWIGVRSSGFVFLVGPNLHTLLPHHLPQVLSVGGFTLIPILMLWGHIRDQYLKRAWIGFLPFLAGCLTVGLWNETRIFGEMSALFAVTAAVLLEVRIEHPQPE